MSVDLYIGVVKCPLTSCFVNRLRSETVADLCNKLLPTNAEFCEDYRMRASPHSPENIISC